MKKPFLLLLAVVTNVGLSSIVCKAQKVTDVSSSYFPTSTYGHINSEFYWDANGDGKKEILSYYKQYVYPEGALPSEDSRGKYYMPFEATSTLFLNGDKWYVRIPYTGDEAPTRLGISPEMMEYDADNMTAQGGTACYEVGDSKMLFTLMGMQKCIADGKESTYNYERELSIIKEGQLSSISGTSSGKGRIYLYKSAGTLYVGLAKSSYELYEVPDYEMARDTIASGYKVSLFHVQSQQDLYYLLYYPNWNFLWKAGNVYYNTLQSSSSYEYRWAWLDSDDKAVKVTNINGSSSDIDKVGHVYDFNGDGQPDFMYNTTNTNIIYMSGNEGYTTVDVSFTKQQLKDNVVADINHDGRLDFFGYEESESSYASGIGMNGTQTTTYVPVVYIQTTEDQFVREYPTLVTDADELRDAMYSTGGNGSFSTASSVPNGWIAKAPALELGTTKTAEVIDINNDGYPDILYSSGRAFLSLPDGRYYAAEMKGEFSICDLNGDGIKDIVTYDSGAQQVLMDISQSDGTFKQTKLIDNGNITGIYCMDLDGDGLVDIQLQAITSTYSFLVFFKNKGDGTFKKTERSLSGKYNFTRPVFLKNNGRPTVLVPAERVGYIAGGWSTGDCYRLKRIDWDANFALSESYVACDKDTLCINEDFAVDNTAEYKKSIADYTIDYDGDGLIDIPGYLNPSTDSLRYVLYSDNATNTAPKRMARPSVVYDKQTGRVRVGWNDGSDQDTAAGDLTYTVRMGTAEGADNLLYYEAGRSNYCVVNAGTWPQGTIYVAVSATDTQGSQGQWSEEASFDNAVVIPDFLLSAPVLSTADTLLVTPLTTFANLTITASPDGNMLQSADGTTRFVFHKAGTKTITANISGGVSTQKTIIVTPFNINTTEPMSYNGYFDLNGNGKNERFNYSTYTANNGIYTYENNAFSKLATLFNSDLSIGGSSHNFSSSYNYFFTSAYVTDKNMDGLPDVFGEIKKNNTRYNWLINAGDLDFEVNNDNCPPFFSARPDFENCYRYADINNDGYIDYFIKHGTELYYLDNRDNYQYINSGISTLYINKGDFTFDEIKIDGYIIDMGDVDGDGLLDLLTYYKGNEGGYHYNIWRNKGNAQFEKVLDTNQNRSFCNHSLADINDDGILDILRMPEYNSTRWKVDAVILDAHFQNKGTIEIPGAPLYADTSDGTLSFYYRERPTYDSLYWQKDGVQGAYPIFRHNNGDKDSSNPRLQLTDLDNDNRPEAFALGNSALSFACSYTNTAPTAPTQVFVNQTDDAVIVTWSGATDAETPTHRLRYNLSVKKKGAEGEGSYIISPLNMTSDMAKTTEQGTMQYRYATRFPIPSTRFEAGKTYEIQVQTIDGWCEHSSFSKVVEFAPGAKVLFTMAEKAGVGQKVAFTLRENSGETPIIDTDGGAIDGNTITWNSAGIKTVSITAGKSTSKRQILIIDKPDLAFSIPEKVLTGSVVEIALPKDYYHADAVSKLTANNGITCSVEEEKGILVMPNKAGTYNIQIEYEDDVFGKLNEERTIEVIDCVPEIIQVAATTEGCLIQWNNNINDDVKPLLTGTVMVYRETSISGKYEVIGKANIADGQFMDKTARPDIKSCRYLITYSTTYGSESQNSRIHGTVLLMANRGIGNDINLHWNDYVGKQVLTYTIFAGSSQDNLQVIDEVSGNTLSYIHHRSSNTPTFYAIGCTFNSDLTQTGILNRAFKKEISSNIICSNEAYSVTLVQNINIYEKDGYNLLNEERPELHMQAIVTPALATLARVEWSITAGSDLAEINRNGVMMIKDNETGGVVTVQARAIDGSEVFGTMDITVAPYHPTGIVSPKETQNDPIIRIANGGLYIDNVCKATDLTIVSLSGVLVYRNKIVADTYIPLKRGVYIVKAGGNIKKITIN